MIEYMTVPHVSKEKLLEEINIVRILGNMCQ